MTINLEQLTPQDHGRITLQLRQHMKYILTAKYYEQLARMKTIGHIEFREQYLQKQTIGAKLWKYYRESFSIKKAIKQTMIDMTTAAQGEIEQLQDDKDDWLLLAVDAIIRYAQQKGQMRAEQQQAIAEYDGDDLDMQEAWKIMDRIKNKKHEPERE